MLLARGHKLWSLLALFVATQTWAVPGLTVAGLLDGQTHQVNEAGLSIAGTVALEDVPTADVTITLTASVPGLVSFVPASPLLVTVGQPAEIKSFVVQGLDNQTVAKNPDFNVTLTTTSADANFNGLTKVFAFKSENNEPVSGNHAPSPIVIISPEKNATQIKNNSKFVIELPFDSDRDSMTLTLCRDVANDFLMSPKCATFADTLAAKNGEAESNWASVSFALFLSLLATMIWVRKNPPILWVLIVGVSSLFSCGKEKLIDSFDIKPRARWSVEMGGLEPSTLYFWKAYVSDGHGNIIVSPVRGFTSGVSP